ncbi:shikimate kinase [Aquimarina rhabdastrellae]
MNIVLIGYMGSGKSHISKALSQKINKSAIDLDDYIEAKEEKTIAEIFSTKGEIYFRKKESEYLKECLKTQENAIISLGGGTPCFGNNLAIIKDATNTITIYLNTTVGGLTKRLILEKSKRPLIAHLESETALEDFIRKHLFERSYYYNQADHNIKTDNKNIEEITEEIISLL